MKFKLFAFLLLLKIQTRAQNWAPVYCFDAGSNIVLMYVDSLHDELIISSDHEHKICGVRSRSIFAFNGNVFRDLDFGLNTHDTTFPSNRKAISCIRFGNKTLFGGNFNSVGTLGLNQVFSPRMALWDGNKWDTLPKKAFRDDWEGGYIIDFFKYEGKLWIFGSIDTMANLAGNNIFTFDGQNFSPVNVPTTYNDLVSKMQTYKGELYIVGQFYNWPYDSINKIIRYKNGNWRSVGNGIKSGLGGIWDMIVYKDTLYLGGEFKKSDGNAGNYLVKWDGQQFHEAGFGDFFDWGGIRQLIVHKNRLYAFGRFKYAANKRAYGAAYYENGKWTVNTDSIFGEIFKAALYKNQIYVAGNFLSINGDANMKYLARLKCPDFDSCKNSGAEYLEPVLFPNPASNDFTLSLNPIDLNSNVTIHNIIGQLIHSQNVNSEQTIIPCGTWSKGLYFVTVNTRGKKKSFKVVKE